jgi:hypothetical protein
MTAAQADTLAAAVEHSQFLSIKRVWETADRTFAKVALIRLRK